MYRYIWNNADGRAFHFEFYWYSYQPLNTASVKWNKKIDAELSIPIKRRE